MGAYLLLGPDPNTVIVTVGARAKGRGLEGSSRVPGVDHGIKKVMTRT